MRPFGYEMDQSDSCPWIGGKGTDREKLLPSRALYVKIANPQGTLTPLLALR